jgi:NAD(P)-dependent dehydrogenase (short-subunit alcohol dehydrogenase family)
MHSERIPALLIAGASPRGNSIGSSMARAYAVQNPFRRIVTVSRQVQVSENGLMHIACDISKASDVQALVAQLCDEGLQLSGVINAIGLLHSDGIRPEKALSQLQLASLEMVFLVNAFAPILLIQALLPLLSKTEATFIASLSARVGSIGDNRLGGWYSYRAAKAAQNQLFKTLAIELARSHPLACCLQLHPGTVDTALSKPFQQGVVQGKLFTPDFSAHALMQVIASKTALDSGTFWDWNGQSVPW